MEENRHLQYLSELQRTIREWRPWSCTLAEVADKLGVDPSRGLEHLEAHNRLIHFGPNVPVELSQRLGLSQTLLKHALSPSTLLLVVICVLYFIWGDFGDAVVVMLVAGLIFMFRVHAEWRADQALAALRNSVPANTTVLRSGREGIVASDELVLGDVITLSRGQLVPADAVVVVCHGLSTDESLITGESANVYKMALDAAYAENNASAQTNSSGAGREHYPLPGDVYTVASESTKSLVYAGTRVASGRAVCIVVATSQFTEVGSGVVTAMHSSQSTFTPLQSRLQQLTEQLSASAAFLCIVIGVVGLLRGMDWLNVVLLTTSLMVATVPAAIPLAAKMFLALCSRKLSRNGLLVRKLHAADALSSVSAIVTDKTGTLTRNQLVVSSILTVTTADGDGEGLAVDVVTPESALATERSAALVTPLYCAWSLSVDPLESRPLARLLASVRRTATARSASSSTMGSSIRTSSSPECEECPQGFQPVLGFGKDFLNTAVLQSLAGAEESAFPRDPTTDAIPLETITQVVTTICQRLSIPAGELVFDPTLRISALTRSSAEAPRAYSPKMQPKSANTSKSPSSAMSEDKPARKHWTVVKGAAEVLLPLCSRVWRAKSTGLQLQDKDIDNGYVEGFVDITPSFRQTISRNATDLAVAGNRVIAYAIAITDKPLFTSDATTTTTDHKRNQPADSPLSTHQRDIRDSNAFRFRDAKSRSLGRSARTSTRNDTDESANAIPTIEVAKGRRLPLLPSDMVFVGAFAFFDPPQQDARPVVQECQEAGIRVIVATGDHPSTALSVASAVGVVESHMSQPTGYGAIDPAYERNRNLSASLATAPSEIHAVTGEMIERSIANHSFNQIIDESNVFARVTPVQKLRLVNALQARGDVVVFIGDGINDAPPLTRADIGICMSGHPSTADVAMDAAGLVVLSGNFSEVVSSLREGRLLKANINKALILYAASKLTLVLLFLFMVAVENISPLLPVQLLLIVLFTDIAAVWAFVYEPAEGREAANSHMLTAQQPSLFANAPMCRHRRRYPEHIGYLSDDRATDQVIVVYALLLFFVCILPLLVPFMVLPQWAMAPVAPSIVFLTWVFSHSLLGTSLRTQVVPIRHVRFWENTPSAVWAICGVVAVVVSVSVPFRGLVGFVQLDIAEWVLVIVAPLVLYCSLEAYKELRFNTSNSRIY
ncbi:hypothetical protein IWW36_000616 [Coemansia brasiliensis]|uniref:Cation-transporting P-type ATPase N-terminal domain-containing protein n=1 Tax=Coemansia brasiliensis TaxID=2650707 RepID=A0A9W8M1M4_9FUNG|nr:hypothetical protein IWW36_000616 [Coemansia brasiliensis]